MAGQPFQAVGGRVGAAGRLETLESGGSWRAVLVLAHMVEQRTREIGIRLALGASVTGIQRLVARETAALAGIGLVIGGGAALMSTSVLERLLFDITARDPWVLATVVLVASMGALAASWLPTRRAMRVDPMVAMRQE